MKDKTYWVKLEVVMAVRAKGEKRAALRAHDIATRQGMFVYDVIETHDAEDMLPRVPPSVPSRVEASVDEVPVDPVQGGSHYVSVDGSERETPAPLLKGEPE